MVVWVVRAAMQAGRLRGAALDVFQTEPLPSSSPLWDMPNVLISPHSADRTATFQVRLPSREVSQRFCMKAGIRRIRILTIPGVPSWRHASNAGCSCRLSIVRV